MNHVMIDLETLGSTPGCAILSIGAVEFDPVNLALGKAFYGVVSLQSCLAKGLSVEASTFYWWMKQSEQARNAITEWTFNIDQALMSLNHYLPADCYVWSHGSSFDLAVLSVAYERCGQVKKWAFRNERDTRTVLDLAGMKMGQAEGAHHALNDAKHQARVIMQALRKIHG